MQTSINDNFGYIVKHYLPTQSTESAVSIAGSRKGLVASHVSPSFLLSLSSLTDVAVELIPDIDEEFITSSEVQAMRAMLN